MSALVGRHAALAVADLAESVGARGNELLRVLAPAGRVDGFGESLADLIDDALRSHRIIRTSSGGRRAPRSVKFLALDDGLSAANRRAVGRMLGRRPEVVMPGDERGVEDFLEHLGSAALKPRELALLLMPSRRTEHESDLGVLARWIAGLDRWQQPSVVDVLREKPILRDTGGVWRQPEQIASRVGDLPRAPRCIVQTEMRPRKSRSAGPGETSSRR